MPVLVEDAIAPLLTPTAIAGGADQSGLRLYNERLILSLVRRYRQLSKIEFSGRFRRPSFGGRGRRQKRGRASGHGW